MTMAGSASLVEAKLESRVFFWAAIIGILLLLPVYFAPVPHPWRLTNIGFVGVALVFQGVYLVIARDPVRFHPMMLLGAVGKLSFAIPAIAFAAAGKAEPFLAIFGAADVAMAAVFLWMWFRLRNRS